MPLTIIKQDITRIKCDAIVNSTDCLYSHGGGLDASIHRTAGEELYNACMEAGELYIGQAIITDSFELPCNYVIHTAGPVWIDGRHKEREWLRSCYTEALKLAKRYNCETVAFPLISAGGNGYPKHLVLKEAMDVISEFLKDNEMTVYIAVYDKSLYELGDDLFCELVSYIERNLHPSWADGRCYSPHRAVIPEYHREQPSDGTDCAAPHGSKMPLRAISKGEKPNLEDMLRSMDKSFSEALFSCIDQKGITDVECYKRANVDRKTFSKIKCNKDYHPSKVTAVSFAIALKLDMDETQALLKTAGLTLSRSNIFDVIIIYFISVKNYDINEINAVLFKYDQLLLGC